MTISSWCHSGVRYVWNPRDSESACRWAWWRVSESHVRSRRETRSGLAGVSCGGGSSYAGGDYGLTSSGRFRVGLTARLLLHPHRSYSVGRLITVGPEFTYSYPLTFHLKFVCVRPLACCLPYSSSRYRMNWDQVEGQWETDDRKDERKMGKAGPIAMGPGCR